MKQYMTLQVERMNRYISLRERKASHPLTEAQRRNLQQYWIAKYATHFRRWWTTAIELHIEHSDGVLCVKGGGEFRRAIDRLKTENKRIIEVRKGR